MAIGHSLTSIHSNWLYRRLLCLSASKPNGRRRFVLYASMGMCSARIVFRTCVNRLMAMSIVDSAKHCCSIWNNMRIHSYCTHLYTRDAQRQTVKCTEGRARQSSKLTYHVQMSRKFLVKIITSFNISLPICSGRIWSTFDGLTHHPQLINE